MLTPKIASDPRVMMGKPVIAGTRITVDLILERMGCGQTIDELLLAYPHITREQVHAALTFAAEVVRTNYRHPDQESV